MERKEKEEKANECEVKMDRLQPGWISVEKGE
jgi:hypothetical protein